MKESFCPVCFERLERRSPLALLFGERLLCDACLQARAFRFRRKDLGLLKVYSLMDHVAPQSRWLFQYKGLKDPALAGAFLSPFQGLLRLLLSPFVVIPLPSSEEREKERGFQTLPTILKDAKIPYLEAFQKRPGPDQKDLSMEEWERVGERILLKRGLSLAGRRVVLFDDVMTTGASMRACARILKEAKPRSLSGLVLMYHSLAKGDSET